MSSDVLPDCTGTLQAAPGWEILKECLTAGNLSSDSVLMRGVLQVVHRGHTAVQDERVKSESGVVMEATTYQVKP